MCLAALRLPGGQFTKQQADNAWNNNPDGAGFGYALNGKIFVRRLMKFEPFWEELEAAQLGDARNVPIMIHFRWATHGEESKQNVHPFYVHPNLIMCHNGIINISSKREEDKTRSDTNIFVRSILASLPHNFWRNWATMWLIESAIGSDKMIFLHSSGQYVIANEKNGDWNKEGTIWFSNNSCDAKYTRYTMTVKDGWQTWRGHDSYFGEGSFDEDEDRMVEVYNADCDFCHKTFNWYLSNHRSDKICKLKLATDMGDERLCDKCYSDWQSWNVPDDVGASSTAIIGPIKQEGRIVAP